MRVPAPDLPLAEARPIAPAEAAARRRPWRRFARSKVLCAGLAIIVFWACAALLAPLLAPSDPNAQHMSAIANPFPSATHWLGADLLRRDILSRVLWGARPVLVLAPAALACSYLVGITCGLVAGYFGGWIDELVSRIVDVLLSFPKIVLYVVLVASLGPSPLNIVLAVILISSPGIARLVRALTLEIRTRDFVAGARTRGESAVFVMLVEILPNARAPLIVDFCMRMGYTIIAIGSLGFLGLGLRPPDPDWGGMVREATPLLTVYPHMALFPAAAILSLVLGFNLVADGLQELGDGS